MISSQNIYIFQLMSVLYSISVCPLYPTFSFVLCSSVCEMGLRFLIKFPIPVGAWGEPWVRRVPSDNRGGRVTWRYTGGVRGGESLPHC